MTTRETTFREFGKRLSGKTIRESNYPGNDCKPIHDQMSGTESLTWTEKLTVWSAQSSSKSAKIMDNTGNEILYWTAKNNTMCRHGRFCTSYHDS